MAVNAVGVWMTRADNMSEEEDEDNLRVIEGPVQNRVMDAPCVQPVQKHWLDLFLR